MNTWVPGVHPNTIWWLKSTTQAYQWCNTTYQILTIFIHFQDMMHWLHCNELHCHSKIECAWAFFIVLDLNCTKSIVEVSKNQFKLTFIIIDIEGLLRLLVVAWPHFIDYLTDSGGLLIKKPHQWYLIFYTHYNRIFLNLQYTWNWVCHSGTHKLIVE